MSMDLASRAISLVQSLLKKAQKVKTNAEDCEVLVGFAQRTLPLLEHLSQHSAIDSGLNRGLEAVVDALELAEEAITQCCKSTAFVAILQSDKISDMLKKASSTLSYALSLLSASNIGVAAETQEEIFNLKEQLKNANFSQSALARQQAMELKGLLEVGFNTNSEGNAEVKRMVEELLQLHSKTSDKKQEDLKLLEACLQDARRNKEKLEEYAFKQIIDAIELGVIESQNAAAGLSSFAGEELASHLRCPISMELMKDPVLLKESGMTYDRASIEHWFQRGRRNDPQTNVSLVSMELIPNVIVSKLVNAFRVQNGERVADLAEHENEERPQIKLQPGLIESKIRSLGSKKNRGITHVFFFLDVTGQLSGYRHFVPDESTVTETSVITGGKWDQESGMLSFIETYPYPFVIVEGTINDQLSTDMLVKHLTLRRKIPLTMLDQRTLREEQKSLELSSYEIPHLEQCPTLQHYVLSPGMLQLDGVLVGLNGEEHSNRLILLLRGNGTLHGRMILETQNGQLSKMYGEIEQGTWNPEDSSLSFRLAFCTELPSTESELNKAVFCHSMCMGTISHTNDTCCIKGPVFIGQYQNVNSNPEVIQALKPELNFFLSEARLRYKHFVSPSIPIPSESLESINFHTSTQAPRIDAGYAGPGLYKIRVHSCLRREGRDCIGHYLTNTQHRRDAGSSKWIQWNAGSTWIGWNANVDLSTTWRIYPAPSTHTGLRIAEFVYGKDSDFVLASHLWSASDKRSADSTYLIHHKDRGYDAANVKFLWYKNQLILVFTDLTNPRWHAKGVLGVPDMSAPRDRLDGSTRSAVVFNDWNEAAGLSLLCVSRDHEDS